MSKTTLEQVLYHEIERVNDQIDLKIIRGRSYRKEAQKHRALLSQLRRLRREKHPLRFRSQSRIMPMWGLGAQFE